MSGTQLELAVHTGSLQAVEHVLLKSSRHQMNERSASGCTPLHLACYHNNVPIVACLLSRGASVDVCDEESCWTALAKALYFGHLRAALLLLQHGSSLDVLDNKSRKPLDLVSKELCAYNALLRTQQQQQHLVYAWGSGANYQLGTGSSDFAQSPIRVEPLVELGAVQIACAKYHSAAISADGHLFTWGWGRGGRLGHPDTHIHSGETALIKPWQVSGLGKRQVVSVATGKHHTLALTSAGELWSFGNNRDGKLGCMNADTQPVPRKIAALHRIRIVAIAAANKHSAAISASGEAYTWGSNSWGQLGYGTSSSSANPTPRVVDALKGKPMQAVAAAKHHTLLLSRDGEVWTFGHKRVAPRKVSLVGSRDVARDEAAVNLQGQEGALQFHKGQSEVSRPTAVAIAAGYAHSCCLTSSGCVLAWASADPQLRVKEVGGPLAHQRAVSLAASKARTSITTEHGDVYFWDAKPLQKQQQQQSGLEGPSVGSLPKQGGSDVAGSWGASAGVLGGSPPSSGVLGSSSGRGSSAKGSKSGVELMEAAMEVVLPEKDN